MARREGEVNRYGERDVRPGHFQHGGGIGSMFHGHPSSGQISLSGTYQDEMGMNRDEADYDWSHDPRSEASNEKHYGKGPKDWMNDERIKDMASEKLYHSRQVDASDIEVTVEAGRIILRGTVQDREQKREAEKVIENLPGVHDVSNELSLRRPGL